MRASPLGETFSLIKEILSLLGRVRIYAYKENLFTCNAVVPFARNIVWSE